MIPATTEQLIERIRGLAAGREPTSITLTDVDAAAVVAEIDRLTSALRAIQFAQVGDDSPRKLAVTPLATPNGDHATYVIGGYGRDRFGLAWNEDQKSWVTDDTFTRYTEASARKAIDKGSGMSIQVAMTVTELKHYRKVLVAAVRVAGASTDDQAGNITELPTEVPR